MAYEIKELGVGGILDQTFAILRDHFVRILAVMSVLYISLNLVIGLVSYFFRPSLPANPTPEQALAAVWGTPPILLIGSVLVNLIVGPLTNAALVQTVAHLYLGKSITLGGAFQLAQRRLVPVILTSILYVLLIILGFMCCIIPGIYLSMRWALALDVAVLEEKWGFEALKRSKELMLSNRTRHYNTLFLLYLLLVAIFLPLNMGVAFIPTGPLQIIASTIISGMVTALAGTGLVVFYFSCRCRADNFDIVHLSETLQTHPGEDEVISPTTE